MRRRIYKYPINKYGEVTMPAGAEILTVQAQADTLQVWAIIDELTFEESFEIRRERLHVVATGDPLPETVTKENYLGTYQLNNGVLVYHVFRSKQP